MGNTPTQDPQQKQLANLGDATAPQPSKQGIHDDAPSTAEMEKLVTALREMRRQVEENKQTEELPAPGAEDKQSGHESTMEKKDSIPKLLLYPRMLGQHVSKACSTWKESDRFLHTVVYTEPTVTYLRVNVHRACNIPVGDVASSDPYVILKIDGVEVARTEILWNTLNPIWEQSFVFPITLTHGLNESAEYLIVEIWDYDVVSADDLLSCIAIPLNSLPGYNDSLTECETNWYWLNNETFAAAVGTFFSSLFKFGEEPPAEKKEEGGKRKRKGIVNVEPAKLLQNPGPNDPCIQLTTKFDHGYEWKPEQLPMIGELSILAVKVNLSYTPGEQFSPYAVIHFGNTWMRLSTQAECNDAVWEEELKFPVYDPGMVLVIGVFNDCCGFLASGTDGYMGKVRLRLSALSGFHTYKFRQRLLVSREKGVKQKGEIELHMRFTYDTKRLLAAYFQPPLPSSRYTEPSNENAHHSVKQSLTAKFLNKQHPPIRPEVLEQMLFLETDRPKFHINIARLQAARVQQALDGLGLSRLGNWFSDVCQWTRPWESILVNVMWVYFCFRPGWIIPSILLVLFCTIVKYYVRRVWKATLEPPKMDVNLMGGLIVNKRQLAEQPKRRSKPRSDRKTDDVARVDDEVVKMADAEDSKAKSSVGIMQIHKQIKEVIAMGPVVQNSIGGVAAALERLISLFSWEDQRVTLLLLVVLVVVFFALFVVPLRLVFAIIGVAVFRHPCLRDELPPPPVNILARLPVRSDRLLYDKI